MKGAIQAGLVAATLAALAFGSLYADAGNTYYRWLDARGNPVNSDRPPPAGTPYDVISTGSNLMRQGGPDEGAVPATTEPTVGNEFDQVKTKPQPVKKNPEQCERARENLETLNSKVLIQIRDDQGELHPLSQEEKEVQRKQAEATIAIHCD